MSRRATFLGLTVAALVVFLLFIAGAPWLLEALWTLAAGWFTHVGTVLPEITINWSGVGILAVGLGLAALLGHRFCRWLWEGTGHHDPWRARWTFAGLGAIVLMFAAGMAFTGVVHQTGWLLRSPERLVGSGVSNERNASASLRILMTAQIDFRENDRDGNGRKDFWRADVAGLFALKGPEGHPIKLIEVSIAGADGRPTMSVESFTRRMPKVGYWFRALRFPGETTPDTDRWAAIAYPDTLSSGRLLFIISDRGVMYKKPIRELAFPEVFPADPEKEGWSILD